MSDIVSPAMRTREEIRELIMKKLEIKRECKSFKTAWAAFAEELEQAHYSFEIQKSLDWDWHKKFGRSVFERGGVILRVEKPGGIHPRVYTFGYVVDHWADPDWDKKVKK